MKYIIFNWKSHPETLLEAKLLFGSTAKAAAGLKEAEVVICPPFQYIGQLQVKDSELKIGGQNCSGEQGGSSADEVPPLILKNMGCEYVILGHSERKIVFGETEEIANKKLQTVLSAGLNPILFFGEMEEMSGDAVKKEIISQLEKILAGVGKQFLAQVLFVYEPAYAVSTQGGQNLTPKELKEKTGFIRSYFAKEYGQDIKLLYGGSVDKDNIQGYLEEGNINGVVVGQASLDPEEVRGIISKL